MDIKDLFRVKNADEIARLKELVEIIDSAEAELALLVGAPPGAPRRGRPPKQNGQVASE